MVKVTWYEGKSAAGYCGRSARSEEDGDPGDLLLAKEKAKEKANDKADGLGGHCEEKAAVTVGSKVSTAVGTKNVRRPKGYAPLPAYEEKRCGERGTVFLERPHVTQSAPGRVTPPA